MNAAPPPPIEDVLPQTGLMRLLDAVESWRPEGVVARAHCDPAAWYADRDGAMPAWIGVELMAQAIAAHVNLLSRLPGGAVRRGVLLGTRGYRAEPGRFGAGATLVVHADVTFRDETGLGAYECRIDDPAGTIARATIKVYEPDDFEAFVRQGTPR